MADQLTRPAPLDPDNGRSSIVLKTEFFIWSRQKVEPEETMSTFKPSLQMRRMQMVALLLLVASGIVNYLDRSALSIANIEVRQELGLSATAMGVLLSAFLMSYAFSQLPAGIQSTKRGRASCSVRDWLSGLLRRGRRAS
jgi:sugar phosphate permease